MASASKSNQDPDQEASESLWDINFEDPRQRISARRQRIRKRMEAAKKVRRLIQVKHVFGFCDKSQLEAFPVEEQCEKSNQLVGMVLENGDELVSNVRIAADHLQVQHRQRHEDRAKMLKDLIAKEDRDTKEIIGRIGVNWPKDFKTKAPTDLYQKILEQKEACNDLLKKRNDLIAVLEMEIKDADNQYKTLIEEFHENTSVLGSRMEQQVQALEGLVKSERKRLGDAFTEQKEDHFQKNDRNWLVRLEAVNRTSDEQMETRLKLLTEQASELDELILGDSESFVNMKHEMESDIAVLADQIQFLEAIHQLNEERLDYEIHVLRKHEEEIVLVKSEQKRKITILQDTINKLRLKVAMVNNKIAKDETKLHDIIGSIRQQLDNLMTKKMAYGAMTAKKKDQIEEMAREDIENLFEKVANADYILQTRYMSKKPMKITLKEDKSTIESGGLESSSRRGVESSRKHSTEESRFAESWGDSTNRPSGSPGSRRLKRSDSQLKKMLSALVHEANFLVEDNLNLLVDDIPEDEKKLFKLDSILIAIGLTGELEVMEILRKHEESGGSTTMTDLRESIMKVIRNHIEHHKPTGPEVDGGAGTDRSRRRLESAGRSGSHFPTTPTAARTTTTTGGGDAVFEAVPEKEVRIPLKSEWDEIKDKIEMFNSKDRMFLVNSLKKYNQSLMKRSELLAKNQEIRQQNEELAMLLRRSSA